MTKVRTMRSIIILTRVLILGIAAFMMAAQGALAAAPCLGRPPPVAPSSLTSETINSGLVRLRWRDNSFDETAFSIYRFGKDNEVIFLSYAASLPGSGGMREAIVGGLECGTRYVFWVRAWSLEGGKSGPSATTTATTYPCVVWVSFMELQILNDQDPGGSGEIWLEFTVNGEKRRWPSSGSYDLESGYFVNSRGPNSRYQRLPIFWFPMYRWEDLEIYVRGWDEEDWPYSDDSLGDVTARYLGADKWSLAGSRSETREYLYTSRRPRGFRIWFSIYVTGEGAT